MRRYNLTVNDNPFEIDVEELDADTFEVQLEGRRIRVRLDAHRDIGDTLIEPRVEIAHDPATSGPAGLRPNADDTAGDEKPLVPRTPPYSGTRAPAPTRAASTKGTLTAPMPGVIDSILVTPGATIAKGDPVLVLEAMKMKNTLYAGRDGTIAEVLVSEGQQVKFGETLVSYGDAQ